VKTPRSSGLISPPPMLVAPPVLLRPHSPLKGLRRSKKTCFMCKSETHLIKDCDFHHSPPRVNAATHSAVSAARVNAVKLSAVSAARINDVKPSAVLAVQHNHTKKVWRPKTLVLDHAFRTTNASMTLKLFDYNDALGRSKSVMAWVPKRN
nr:hypothetical protein [Tanacetum cinerariifolium]